MILYSEALQFFRTVFREQTGPGGTRTIGLFAALLEKGVVIQQGFAPVLNIGFCHEIDRKARE